MAFLVILGEMEFLDLKVQVVLKGREAFLVSQVL